MVHSIESLEIGVAELSPSRRMHLVQMQSADEGDVFLAEFRAEDRIEMDLGRCLAVMGELDGGDKGLNERWCHGVAEVLDSGQEVGHPW